jgi:hypothetical protein
MFYRIELCKSHYLNPYYKSIKKGVPFTHYYFCSRKEGLELLALSAE